MLDRSKTTLKKTKYSVSLLQCCSPHTCWRNSQITFGSGAWRYLPEGQVNLDHLEGREVLGHPSEQKDKHGTNLKFERNLFDRFYIYTNICLGLDGNVFKEKNVYLLSPHYCDTIK